MDTTERLWNDGWWYLNHHKTCAILNDTVVGTSTDSVTGLHLDRRPWLVAQWNKTLGLYCGTVHRLHTGFIPRRWWVQLPFPLPFMSLTKSGCGEIGSTRHLEVVVLVREWGFKSLHPHQSGVVAQLASASPCHGEGWGIVLPPPRQIWIWTRLES